MSLSIIILAKNEEKNIEACLDSAGFADETLVIDDFSVDNTAQIAERLGAKVYKRHLEGNFALQRNYGLDKASSRWVLFLDADERISEKLKIEIKKEIEKSDNPLVGYYLKREDFIFGKRLRFGETASLAFLRLARKSAGKWKRNVHEVWEVSGRTITLKNPLLHYPHQTLREFINDINFHSDLDVAAKKREGKKANLKKIIFWPVGKFVNNWIFRLGFLDGMEGMVMALMMSLHSFLSWSKLWIYQRKTD